MANSPHLSGLQMVPDYSLDNESKQIPYFDWISQDEETGRNGSSDQKMIERVIWCQVLAKKEWMLKNRTMMGALRHRLWMESMVWMRFALGGKISVNFDGLVRPASRLGHQIIPRIQQIFLHFCKIAFDGVVNSLSLAQSVDWSILFVQLYEQTIQGCTMRFLYLQRTPSAPIQELMFYNAFRKGIHPAMKWTGWVFTEPLIC